MPLRVVVYRGLALWGAFAMNLANLRGLFTRRTLTRFAISVAVSAVIGMVAELALDHHARAEAAALQGEAYESISQFAPWNVAIQYFSIIVLPDSNDAYAKKIAEQREAFRQMECGPLGVDAGTSSCAPPTPPSFYLSQHVPIFLRPLTAFFDLVFHLLADNGVIGALVALVQIVLGVLVTLFIGRREKIGFESWAGKLVGIPIAVMVLGSIAALPLWLVSLLGVMILKAVPLAAVGAQTGATAYMVSWVGGKMAEEVGHEVVMKQVERIVRD